MQPKFSAIVIIKICSIEKVINVLMQCSRNQKKWLQIGLTYSRIFYSLKLPKATKMTSSICYPSIKVVQRFLGSCCNHLGNRPDADLQLLVFCNLGCKTIVQQFCKLLLGSYIKFLLVNLYRRAAARQAISAVLT